MAGKLLSLCGAAVLLGVSITGFNVAGMVVGALFTLGAFLSLVEEIV